MDRALQHGAHLRTGEKVLGWRATGAKGSGVAVTTDKGTYHADRLVLAAGAWMPQLVPELQARSPFHWFFCQKPSP